MNRVLLLALPLLLGSVVLAQPDPQAPGMAVNPPEAQPHFNVSTPEGAVRNFVNDLKSGLEPSLAFDVVGARPGFYGPDDWPGIFEGLECVRNSFEREISIGRGRQTRFSAK